MSDDVFEEMSVIKACVTDRAIIQKDLEILPLNMIHGKHLLQKC